MSEITYRPFQITDVDAFINIIKAQRRLRGEPEMVDRDEIMHQIDNPIIDIERDIFVGEHEGEVVAVGGAFLIPTGQAVGMEGIHPDFDDDYGIRDYIVTTGDAHILKRAQEEVPAEKPVYINRNFRDDRQDIMDTYASHGYAETRRFYEMKIDLDDTEIPAPEFADGLEVRAFDQENHLESLWKAQQESFKDHWGSSEETPFEQWSHNFTGPNFDPTLYFVAWDGDEIAGMSMCVVDTGEESTGHVNILGVRRPWRKKGLGTALLHYSFKEFQKRGFKHVNLGVDAASKTNAVALYERAGMYADKCIVIYRKVLRGNAEDILD